MYCYLFDKWHLKLKSEHVFLYHHQTYLQGKRKRERKNAPGANKHISSKSSLFSETKTSSRVSQQCLDEDQDCLLVVSH